MHEKREFDSSSTRGFKDFMGIGSMTQELIAIESHPLPSIFMAMLGQPLHLLHALGILCSQRRHCYHLYLIISAAFISEFINYWR